MKWQTYLFLMECGFITGHGLIIDGVPRLTS